MEPPANDPLYSVPHYIIQSKQVKGGKFAKIASWFRRMIIEEIYYRLSEYLN